MKTFDLIEGNITQALFKLALPVMGTSFIQMAYNMIDMIWIGRLGSSEVASVGTAGFYLWMSFGVLLIAKIGAQVNVAQNIGRRDIQSAQKYSVAGIQGAIILGLFYTLIVYYFRIPLIDFFNIDDAYVNSNAVEYLQIAVIAIFFAFINEVISGIIIGSGNSHFPFKVNMVGLLTNITMDPILIFGIGAIPAFGVKGAAVATALSQFAVTLIYVIFIKKSNFEFLKISIFKKIYLKEIIENARIGLPVSLQSLLFTLFSMILARIIAFWGPVAVAIQRVGGQIESVSWRTAEGFSSSLSTFIGQNFGAQKKERVKAGYMTSLKIITGFGIMTTLLMVLFPHEIIRIFIPEPESIRIGSQYIKILGYSQLLMCIEIMTQGAFAGMGKTKPPAIVGVSLNAARIPLAILLTQTFLGLDGVWWSITITSIFKGMIIMIWFLIVLNKYMIKK
ncbi:MAG: MATE family efflux transporter [Tissierellales bacterium]|nr:MATE family efflux transporter [Tissierellales bacterium]